VFRIRRIRMFLGLLNADPDPLIRGTGYGSGSGSFYHLAIIVRKTLIPTVLWLLFVLTFYLWKMMSMCLEKVIREKTKKIFFCILKANDEKARSGSTSGSISHRHGSADPDPHPNVMDPQHWNFEIIFTLLWRNHLSDIYGIWFYEKTDCEKVGRKVEQLVQEVEARQQARQAAAAGGGDLAQMLQVR
jgi:hypothetical protein